MVLISWKVSTSGPYFLKGLVPGPYMGGPYKTIMRVLVLWLWWTRDDFHRSNAMHWVEWRWELANEEIHIVGLVLEQVVFCLITFTNSSSLFTFELIFQIKRSSVTGERWRPCLTSFSKWKVMKTNFSERTLRKSRNLSKRRTLKKVWPELSFQQFSCAEFSCDNWA